MTTDDNNQNEQQSKKTRHTKATKKPQKTGETQKISIELYKYKTLIDALEDRHKVKRVIITIFILGMLLFAGITVITLSIKRLYPYSDITTNGLGATTIKSEKNEVSYWLFNTAILWANSGIAVDKGDIITIRASGKSHTAIHHLYDAAKNNKEKWNNWVGSEGESDQQSGERDTYRRRFRIFPDMPSGALLMQVKVSDNGPFDTPLEGDPDNFYFIGKERQHIYINNGGTLCFAVNDIVLNRSTITSLMWENIRQKYIKSDSIPSIKEEINRQIKKKIANPKINLFQELHLPNSYYNKDYDFLMDSIKSLFDTVFKEEIKDTSKKIGIMELGRTNLANEPDSKLSNDSIVCELSYYYGKEADENGKRKTAWFDDNIGSFLIVVEKTK